MQCTVLFVLMVFFFETKIKMERHNIFFSFYEFESSNNISEKSQELFLHIFLFYILIPIGKLSIIKGL